MCGWCRRCGAFVGDVGNLRGIGGYMADEVCISWRVGVGIRKSAHGG